jgi:hypothetical protein
MKINPGVRYDMPAVFGPSFLGDTTKVPDIEAIVVSFETDRDSAAELLPRFYSIADRALISMSRITYRGVDYLGGREYREIVFGVSCLYNGPEGRIAAPYLPVLWVSEVSAIIAGREMMGYAKLGGELADVERTADSRSFECAEFGTPLFRGEATHLQAIEGDSLAKLRRNTAEAVSLGWKYIAGPEGTVDADYPTKLIMRWNYERAWTGDSRLVLKEPTDKEAPFSARIVRAIAALPVREYRRAFVGQGSAVIDRAATRRLSGGA